MADKKVKGAGDRFLPGSNIAKHREWRGLKDTWYDYVEWVKVLGIMGGFVAKSPVRIARGMLTYRWMGSYLGALNMIDRCVEGLRGPALRVARLYLNTIMKGSTTSIAEMMMGDRRFGDNAFGRTQVVLEQTMCPEILAGFKNLRPRSSSRSRGCCCATWIRVQTRTISTPWRVSACQRIPAACRTMPPASRCSMSSRRSAPAASRITLRVTPRP